MYSQCCCSLVCHLQNSHMRCCLSSQEGTALLTVPRCCAAVSCASVAIILLAVGGIAATVEMRKLELRAAHMPPGVCSCRCDSRAEATSSTDGAVRQKADVCTLADLPRAGLRFACTFLVTGRVSRPLGPSYGVT